jgi:transposase
MSKIQGGPSRWFAGIDWADAHHEVVVIDEAGTRVGQLRVAHAAHGVEQLIAWLRASGEIATCPEHLACLIETTQGVLMTALLEQGAPVYPVNPKLLDHSRKPSGAKTDAIDAGILARIGRSALAELRRLRPDPPRIAELKTLTRDQDALIQTQTRLTNQLIACLKAYDPAALSWFDRVAQGITLTFLETFPTPSDCQRASLARLPGAPHRAAAGGALSGEGGSESAAALGTCPGAAVAGPPRSSSGQNPLDVGLGGASAAGDAAGDGR